MVEKSIAAAEEIQKRFGITIDRATYLLNLCNSINSTYPDAKISECVAFHDIGSQFIDNLDTLHAIIETSIYKLERFVGEIRFEPPPPAGPRR